MRTSSLIAVESQMSQGDGAQRSREDLIRVVEARYDPLKTRRWGQTLAEHEHRPPCDGIAQCDENAQSRLKARCSPRLRAQVA